MISQFFKFFCPDLNLEVVATQDDPTPYSEKNGWIWYANGIDRKPDCCAKNSYIVSKNPLPLKDGTKIGIRLFFSLMHVV